MAEIAANPVLLAEAKATIPLLSRVAEPCGEEAVRRALAPLAAVYGLSEAARTRAFWGVYFEALADLPAEAVATAAKAYAKRPDAEFFPKPGPLRGMALDHAEPIFKALSRAKRAALTKPPLVPTYADRVRAPELHRVPGEDRQRIAADALRQLDESRSPKPERQAYQGTPGKVDHTGLTAEMRRHMGLNVPEAAQA